MPRGQGQKKFRGKKWRGRRKKGPGRPYFYRVIQKKPRPAYFEAFDKNDNLIEDEGEVVLYPDELEALRLVDCQNLTQIEAGEEMAISRGTIWRLLNKGREKIVRALFLGQKIIIKPIEEKEKK
ncbi:MAG: DUF134 domain-containing protein [Candidatus Lokiarchaeota archaeon]|nr:DUF134 domain-containing protein [Candidatus Lokiarchaeota archaeon]